MLKLSSVADLYIVLYDSIIANPDGPGHGRAGFYFGENGEHSLYEVGQAISRALKDTGLLKGENTEPTAFTKEELGIYFMVCYLNLRVCESTQIYSLFKGSESYGTNARCKSVRAKALGWKPVYTKSDFLGSLKHELEDGRWKGAAKKFADIIRIAHRL